MVDAGARLPRGADYVARLQAFRVALNGLGDYIPVECDHRGYAPRRSLQGTLPGQVIAFIYDAAQWNSRLLHCPNIARDAHQNQPVPRNAKESIGQCCFKSAAAAGSNEWLLKDRG